MSLISISADLYIDPASVESLSIINEVDGRQYVHIVLKNCEANIPLGAATLDQVAEKINEACMVLNL